MTVCNDIKRRIDEADNLELLDLDIMRHTAACSDCRHFAGERAALRGLLATTVRVAAPVNFDAMLQARLAEAKARKSHGWLNAAFYLRAGVATAGLVVAVFVAQYSGLFNGSPVRQDKQSTASNPTVVAPQATAKQEGSGLTAQQPSPSPNTLSHSVATGGGVTPSTVLIGSSRPRSSSNGGVRGGRVLRMTPGTMAMEDSGAILIRGRNGEHDIAVPTVSVGAQPLVYVNAGRQPQPSRALSVSF